MTTAALLTRLTLSLMVIGCVRFQCRRSFTLRSSSLARPDYESHFSMSHCLEAGFKSLTVKIWLLCTINCLFTVVMQDYKAYVNQEHVISGNDVLFKCDIPSFVADFVSVQSWADNEGVIHATHSQGNRQICAKKLGLRIPLDLRLLLPYQSDSSSLEVFWCRLFRRSHHHRLRS